MRFSRKRTLQGMRKHSGKSSIRRKRHAANNRKKVLARHRRYTVATMPCSSR